MSFVAQVKFCLKWALNVEFIDCGKGAITRKLGGRQSKGDGSVYVCGGGGDLKGEKGVPHGGWMPPPSRPWNQKPLPTREPPAHQSSLSVCVCVWQCSAGESAVMQGITQLLLLLSPIPPCPPFSPCSPRHFTSMYVMSQSFLSHTLNSKGLMGSISILHIRIGHSFFLSWSVKTPNIS